MYCLGPHLTSVGSQPTWPVIYDFQFSLKYGGSVPISFGLYFIKFTLGDKRFLTDDTFDATLDDLT